MTIACVHDRRERHSRISHLAAEAATSPPHALSTASLPTNALSRALLFVSTAPWGDDRANFLCRATNSRLASPLPLHSSRSPVRPQLVSPGTQGQAQKTWMLETRQTTSKGKAVLEQV